MKRTMYLRTGGMENLCEKTGMPEEVTSRIVALMRTFDFSALEEPIDLLFDCSTGSAGVDAIEERIGGDVDFMFIWLAIWLGCALRTHEMYRLKGIDDQVFYATMGCFARFTKEHKESFGVYGFDRSIWTYRMIAMKLFRLGELEFEMTDYQGPDLVLGGDTALGHGEPVLYVHIPSDAQLEGENCHESYRLAKSFFDRFYPEYAYNVLYTDTWLLSPNLQQFLPEGSRIMNFQKDYRICLANEDSTDFLGRVFKNPALEPSCYPENTSLQRKIKKHILKGGRIGTAAGIILPAPSHPGSRIIT